MYPSSVSSLFGLGSLIGTGLSGTCNSTLADCFPILSLISFSLLDRSLSYTTWDLILLSTYSKEGTHIFQVQRHSLRLSLSFFFQRREWISKCCFRHMLILGPYIQSLLLLLFYCFAVAGGPLSSWLYFDRLSSIISSEGMRLRALLHLWYWVMLVHCSTTSSLLSWPPLRIYILFDRVRESLFSPWILRRAASENYLISFPPVWRWFRHH